MTADSSLKGQRQIRLEKIAKLAELGINSYPTRGHKSHDIQVLRDRFTELVDQEVSVVGRLMSWREHGQLVFGDVQDKSGRIQLYIKSDAIAPTSIPEQTLGWEHLNLLDVGDHLEATGILTQTQRGEISILVHAVKLLTKAIRPLPDKWHGITDVEERFRRRYLDMTMNPEVRERFVRRSKFWTAVRDFMNAEGFVEVNVPVLEHVTGGADANPFVTHFDALDQDFYLRISHELPLKRLLGAGFEKVYDIGPRFRNEGFSDEHLPEHIAMEWYWAYADYRDGMELTTRMFRQVMQSVYGTQQFQVRGFDIDLTKDWEVIDYTTIIKERFGIDIFHDSVEKMNAVLQTNGVLLGEDINRNRIVDNLWKLIRRTIAGPAFLVGVPTFMSPLAKVDPQNTEITQRFQPIIAGSEMANAYTELNDPVDQLNRFVEQQQLRDAGDAEAQMLDIDYVEMLEYGMPPAVGFGLTERVFWFFENVVAKEGVPFPQLKANIDSTTREIYAEIGELLPTANHGKEVETSTTSDKFVIGRVEEINKHENADRLVVCRVFVGDVIVESANEPSYLQIVTGAQNLTVGDLVPVALPGAIIPATGNKLKPGNLRGVRSEAMMCSQKELNLGDDSEGIMLLDKDKYSGQEGQIFEF